MFRLVCFIMLLFTTSAHADICSVNPEISEYFIKCDGVGCQEAVQLQKPFYSNCYKGDVFYSVIYFSKEEIDELLFKSEMSDSEITEGVYKVYKSFIPFGDRTGWDYGFSRVEDLEEFDSIVKNLKAEAFEGNIWVYVEHVVIFILMLVVIIIFIFVVLLLFSFITGLIQLINNRLAADASDKPSLTITTIILNFPIIVIIVVFAGLSFLILFT